MKKISLYTPKVLATMSSLALLLSFLNASSQHDHDHAHGHSHGDEAVEMEVNAVNEQSVSENSSKLYEALLKFTPVEPGDSLNMTLFLSDFRTNFPVDSAQVNVLNADFPSETFSVMIERPGVYMIRTIMPEEKTYNLDLDITTPQGKDYITLPDVDFSHHHAETGETHDHGIAWWMYLIGLAVLIVGIIIGAWFGRKYVDKKVAVAILFLCMLPLSQFNRSYAHEGHDHGPAKKTGTLSGNFMIQKESQFLLEIRTVVSGDVEFDGGRRLYGTVVPGPDGHAAVSSSQSGKIISISVKPGDRVTKGQVLGVIERSLEAGNDITYQAEKNRLDAEFEAAKKDYERMQSLADISSAKSVEEAKSRYDVAKKNRDLFNSGAKNLTLVSPISGIISPFALSPGSSVNADQELFVVNNLSKVYVEAQAFEKDIEVIELAQEFSVQCSEDMHETREVRLLSLVQEFNASNQSQRVLFEVNNPEGEFKLGEFVNVWVMKKGGSAQLALPEESITEIEGRPVVFIKNSAEQFELRYVSTGDRNGSEVVIKNGIKPGERVVSDGAYQAKLIYLNQ